MANEYEDLIKDLRSEPSKSGGSAKKNSKPKPGRFDDLIQDLRTAPQEQPQTQPSQPSQPRPPIQPQAESMLLGDPLRDPVRDPVGYHLGTDTSTAQARQRREQAIASGIDPTGVGMGTRATLNELPEGLTNELELIKEIVQRGEGIPIEEVRKNPDNGDLEFRRKGGEGWAKINTIGFDPGDIAAMLPHLKQLAAEVMGGITGGFAGAIGGPTGAAAGALTGESLASAYATYYRLKNLQAQGYNISDEDIWTETASAGGWTAAGGLAGSAAFKVFRSMIGELPSAITELATPENIQRVERGIEKTQQTGIPATTGQILRSRDPDLPGVPTPEVFGVEQVLTQRGEAGRPIREVFQQQDVALQQELSAIAPQASREDILLAQQTFKNLASTQPLARQEHMRADAEAATKAVLQEFTAKAKDPILAGQAFRSAAERAKDQTLSPLHKRYDEMQAELGDTPVSLEQFRARMEAVKDRLEQRLLPSLQRENARLAKEASEAGTETAKILEEGLEITEVAVDSPIPLSVIQDDLSAIRDEMRRLQNMPGASQKQKAMLADMHSALMEARNEGLPEEVLGRVLELERAYGVAKSEFERGVVGRLLQSNVEGFRIRDGQVIENIMSTRDGSNARVLNSILSKSSQGRLALEEIRRGVLGQYAEVTGANKGLPNPKVHDHFVQRNEKTLRALFPGKQFDRFNNVGKMFRQLNEAQRTQKEFERKTKGNLAAFLDDKESNLIVDKLYHPDRQTEMRQALKLLNNKKFEDKAQGFKAELANLMARDLATQTDQGTTMLIPNFQSFDKFLNTQWKVDIAKEAFGNEYVAGLKSLREALKIADQSRSIPDQDMLRSLSAGGGLNGYARFLRVAFPPLSAKGRFLTATVGVLHDEAARKTAEILADPTRFKELAKLHRMSFYGRPAATIFGNLGLHAFQALALHGPPSE